MGQPTILIVDDEPLVLSVLAKLLGKRYEILTASSLPDARRLMQTSDEIDLAIVDYLVLTETGLEFLSDLRQSHPLVKRILMSGKMDPELMASAINNDIAHRVITKPWHNAEILELVNQLLCHRPHSHFTPPTVKNILFSGSLEGIRVADIVYLLTTNDKDGILFLKDDRLPDAKIYLRNGRIVDAVSAGISGPRIVDDLLERTSGQFSFMESAKFEASAEGLSLAQQILVI